VPERDDAGRDGGRRPVIKQAPTLRRLLVIVAFLLSCVSLFIVLWLRSGGTLPLQAQGYRFHVHFAEAVALDANADVRISGVSVGHVVRVKLASDDRTDALLELDRIYAPIPSTTRAILRTKTLLGETYVELTPGSRRAAPVPDGGRLSQSRVSDAVQLDEIVRSFDAPTRRALAVWIRAAAAGAGGHGRDISESIALLVPALDSTDRLVTTVDRQRRSVARLLRSGGAVSTALGDDPAPLRALVTSLERLTAATAAEGDALTATVRELPGFERVATTSLRTLGAFARRADPDVALLRTRTRRLSPTLTALAADLPDLNRTIAGLDATALAATDGLPAVDELLGLLPPALAKLMPSLGALQPTLAYLSTYSRELTSAVANLTAATQATAPGRDGPIHYLRADTVLNPSGLANYPRPIGSARANAYPAPGSLARLPTALSSYDVRACAHPTPRLPAADGGVLTPELRRMVADFVFAGAPAGTAPASPCIAQRPAGATYPQVTPLSSEPSPRRARDGGP
jgi:phospholipid/cholesterol/gamma-HCH transport system substrate-binding protein